tara:strand:+ start:58 stop:675 length:618 start_codon:yes stop_codon:yes gene_type:complete
MNENTPTTTDTPRCDTAQNSESTPQNTPTEDENSGDAISDESYEDLVKYDSDKEDSDDSEFDLNSGDDLIKMFGVIGYFLLMMLINRDFGIEYCIFTSFAGYIAYLLYNNKTDDYIKYYGIIRQKMDIFLPPPPSDNISKKHEIDEKDILLLKFIAENDATTSDDTWTVENLNYKGLLYLLNKEDKKGQLKMRFRDGKIMKLKIE